MLTQQLSAVPAALAPRGDGLMFANRELTPQVGEDTKQVCGKVSEAEVAVCWVDINSSRALAGAPAKAEPSPVNGDAHDWMWC